MAQTRLPTLDVERSLRLWEEWGERPPPPPAAPKSYLQSPGRAPVEEQPAPAVKVVRTTKKVRRK